jgi:hypothetical protein
MLGSSQITRLRPSVAGSAPGDGDADGCDRPAAGLRWQALLAPADPGTSRQPRRSDERVTAAYSPSVIREAR